MGTEESHDNDIVPKGHGGLRDGDGGKQTACVYLFEEEAPSCAVW